MTSRQEKTIRKRLPRVEITEDIRCELLAHKNRTQAGARKMLRLAGVPAPKGLSANLVQGWLGGIISSARSDHLSFVREQWANLPTREGEIITITPDLLANIQAHKERAGTGTMALLSKRSDVPPGLTPTIINSWIEGKTKTANSRHIEYVLKCWDEIAESDSLVTLGADILKRLRSYGGFGGLLPGHIFEGAKDIPAGLDSHRVSRWLSGKVSRAQKVHLDYVLMRCEEMQNDSQRRIKISDDILERLRQHKERTGLGPGLLFQTLSDIPGGLTSAMVQSWLGKNVRTARKDYLEYVLEKWESA